jgi:hypothetical protein
MDRAAVLQRLEEREPCQSLGDAGLMATVRTRLAAREQLEDNDDVLTAILPLRARFCGGRASLIDPAGAPVAPARPDHALIKAIARAYK